ncbi:MAG: hypothetical protein Q7U47_03400 [Paludibacter sp.]|nr:hypothetical protein [Paludibacter sp.]
MNASDFSGLIIIISIAYIVLSIFIIKAFFRMSENLKIIKENTTKDLKIIKESLVKEPKVRDLSIFKLLEGKKEEAVSEIRKSFILECTLIIEKYNDADREASNLIEEYVYRYRKSLKDEITLEYLTEIFKSIKTIIYGELDKQ